MTVSKKFEPDTSPWSKIVAVPFRIQKMPRSGASDRNRPVIRLRTPGGWVRAVFSPPDMGIGSFMRQLLCCNRHDFEALPFHQTVRGCSRAEDQVVLTGVRPPNDNIIR